MESGDDEPQLSLLEVLRLAPRYLGRSDQLCILFGRGLLGTHIDEDDENDSSEESTQENEDNLASDSCKMQKKKLYNNPVSHGCSKRNHNTWKYLQAREIGISTEGQRCEGFSKSDQSCVFSRYLPNSVKDVMHYSAKVFCGNYSQDGSVFMSASQDCHINLYETSTGKLRQFQEVLAQNVGWSIIDTAYSHDQRHLIYSSWSPNIYLCDISGGYEKEHIPLDMRPGTHSFCAFSITFSQDDHEILTGSNDNCLYIYDRSCSKRTLRIKGHEDDVNAVCFCDNTSQLLFSGSDDGLCKVWDRRTLDEQNPEPVGTFAGHACGIACVDSKGDGRYLITSCKDQTIKLWDMRKFSSEDCVQAGIKATNSYQFWDYRWEAIPKKFTSDRGVNVKGDPSVMTYRGHTLLRCLSRAHFSPAETTGQKYIYTGSADGCIYIYDVHTGRIVRKLSGHESIVRDVSWHPYKPLIMSSSWDHTVKCWHYCRSREERERSDKEILRDEQEEEKEKKLKRKTWSNYQTSLLHVW